jgi:HJR/Mrr/RecB family endonuclease/phosphotransferase system HPr-like phosphotransfer protein
MSESDTQQRWVEPASIPFARLKGKDLEECVYWLFDAMGAKDLEWRTGGKGGGAADGGRDLEAHFFTPSIDDELEPKVWWIECKGRKETVEKSEVQQAVVNAQARGDLDYLVVATNSQFSNPTTDWVKEWQKNNPKPKVKLWDHSQLERLLSRHPSVVLRLFSEALSSQGHAEAMESRFWNRLELSSQGTLEKLWAERDEIEFTAMGLFAATVSEFSNGNIGKRSWAAQLDARSIVKVLHLALINAPYILIKCSQTGANQEPILRALSYLILAALRELPPKNVAELITGSLFRQGGVDMPEQVRLMLLLPITDQLLSEMQDVCSNDCSRISSCRRSNFTEQADEIDTYWDRFQVADTQDEDEESRYLLIESTKAPCVVGFEVGEDVSCPLFSFEPDDKNVAALLAILKRVSAFRNDQAVGENMGVEGEPNS